MPANQRQQTGNPKSLAQSPTSPSSKATAKYTNKDGSKFITVPKSPDVSETPNTAMVQTASAPNGQAPPASTTINGTNKKKQKRREKMAAKLAAEQGGQNSNNDSRRSQETQQAGGSDRHTTNGQFDPAEEDLSSDDDGDGNSGSYDQDRSSPPPNGHSNPPAKSSKKKKKSKTNQSTSDQARSSANGIYHTQNHSHNHPPPLLPSLQQNMPRGPGISREKIWNTSSQEERERIKEFWLSLGEDERKSLVKVEKDAVLKKMKEQQKHSCSCTVCGRKRTAIEEELEVLYDAYYEELEQYANHQGDGGPQPMMPPPRRFGPLSGLQPPNRMPPAFQQPSRGRIVEQSGDDEDEEGDEEYSDDPDEDEYSDEEPEEIPRNYQTDFFNFGNSLTVQGGILTVADDLLKNDGKKFIEMMEQLAERRMQREEDNNQQAYYSHPPNGLHAHHTHNHPPPPADDEYDDDEEDDDYDSQDEDYDEDDEEELDTMTEEQRMEEGRRMFQIFAARMFEQRVLTAYKEKVAKERQDKLMEEVEEESKREAQKKAKKAKDAQKKKEKLQQKKQQAAEEKARKEAEKAAEDAAKAEAEEKAREAQRQKDEEKRKKREAVKQAEAAERLKKEAERQRRVQEAKDRQAEEDRRKREAKEKEKEKKEELRRLEREAKELEAKEKKAKQDQEKRDKEAKSKAEKDARDQQQRDELASQQAAVKAAISAHQAPKRPPVPIPANFQSQPTAIASPHVQVATPAVPKAPTPSRLRTASQQESSGSSVPQTPQTGGMSQNVSPVPSTPLQGSPGPIGPPGKTQNHQPYLHHPQASSPMHSALKNSPGLQNNPYPGMPPLNMPFQSGIQPIMPPGFGRLPFDPGFPHPPMGGQYRPMAGPNGMPVPPGMLHQIPQGRGFPIQNPPPGFPQSPNSFGGIGQPFGTQKDSIPAQSHSRHPSASFDIPTSVPTTQPIGRPAPIGRPSSVVHGQRHGENFSNDVDDLSNALGSSALIDDSDEPLNGPGLQRSNGVPGNIQRHNFPPPPFGMEQYGSPISGTPWGAQPNPFGSTSLPGSSFTGGWPQSASSSFGAPGASAMRTSQPRPVTVRLMICRACKELDGSTPDGFYDIDTIKAHIDQLHPPVTEDELIDICGTEGNPSNGGGYLDIRKDSNGHISIRHEIDVLTQRMSAPGEIGSPIVGGGSGRFPPPGL